MAIEAESPKKATWKGFLSFSMVSIPVKMYLAADDKGYGFHLLCKEHQVPVTGKRRCTADDKVLEPFEVVKGMSVGPQSYIIFDDADFDTLPLRTMKSIDIESFIPQKQVPIATHARGVYFLVPEREGAPHYALLRAALEKKKVFGLGRFAVRDKEQLGVIFVQDNCIMLTTLCWPSAMRSTAHLALPLTKPKKADLQLALKIVEGLRTDWEPEKYVDSYRIALEKLAEAKISGKKTTVVVPPIPPTPDLQMALRASVNRILEAKAVVGKNKQKKPAA